MSLVAWYPLIDGSLENKGLDTTPLTLHGTVPFTNGRVRTAPTFSANASNYYTMPPITKVNDFSICCWVKCSSTANGWIFWQGEVGSGNKNIGFIDASGVEGKLKYRYGNLTYTSNYTANTWVHMCMTIDENGYVHTYLNGENDHNSSVDANYEYVEGHDLCIGKAETVFPWQNGQLQDFRYYDHCLSPKEVKEIAKGLCLHLPLKGTNARPNLFKNSATMFNSTGNSNIPYSTWTKTLEFDENAPCGVNGKKLKIAFKREEGAPAGSAGVYYRFTDTAMPNLTIGATYCETVWARCTIPNVSLLNNVAQGQSIISNSKRTLTSEWKRYYFIFNATSETYTTCFYMENVPVGIEGVFEVCCPKLELLSPTPYIPNVNDTQYSDYVLDYEPDCSGNAFDATKYGDLTTSDSNGRYNTAVAFNGTNTYLQGLAPTNSECKEFTIATWVKLNNVSTGQTIYACRTVGMQGVVLFYAGANGILFDDGVRNAIFSNSTLEPDKWYHIAVTRDTTTRKLYINGSFVSSGATTGALANMANMYQVGECNAQTAEPKGNYLNGSLSDFRLYTSVLSADDVKELYETSVSIAHNPPSLTESAYYNYVEEQKHSTFDLSKFTVVGSPTITDDGVASGFNSSNTINLNTTISASSANVDYIIRNVVLSDDTGTRVYKVLFGSANENKAKIGYLTSQNRALQLYNGSAWTGSSYRLSLNMPYDIKLNWNGTTYTLYAKLSSETEWTQVCSYTASSNILTSNLFLGRNSSKPQEFLSGSIDLKQFSITVDGKEVFSGNKTGLDVIKPDNYTVVGSPVISEDGVASGFSGSWSNYIKTVGLPDITSGVSFEIKTKLKFNNEGISAFGSFNYRFNIQRFSTNLNCYISSNGKTWDIANNVGINANISINSYYYIKFLFDGAKYKLGVSKDDANYIYYDIASSTDKMYFPENSTISISPTNGLEYFDLNAFKIYVDGNLVYQPCLKIPYTESKTGIKVVDSVYLDRVKDVYDQHYLERYYTVDETTQTVYEYPLFRDSMHAYEFDEGFDQSIKKIGVMISPEFTETTDVNMVKGNTKTTKLIEV